MISIIKLTNDFRKSFADRAEKNRTYGEANIARQTNEFEAFSARLTKAMPEKTYKGESIAVLSEKLGDRHTVSVRVPAADYEIRLILTPDANDHNGEIAMESWGYCVEKEMTTWRPYDTYGSLCDAMISFCHNAAGIVSKENIDAVLDTMNETPDTIKFPVPEQKAQPVPGLEIAA